MILFPAIDLKDGACVRLLRGDMDAATVFNDSPSDQARAFVEAGADWLHIVDLNGAFDGQSVNGDAVRGILDVTRAAGVQVQLGGGIRTPEHVAGWLADGVDRVILGTAAVKDPNLVIESCKAYPDQVAVGIDARGGRVAVEGWAETSDLAADALARRFEDAGVAALIYTDIDRDGAMQGPNVDATVALARAVSIPVIASGGVSSLDDVEVFLPHEKDGIAGVISGRAIYDGRIDLAAALTRLREAV
ncbi:MAG: 1-(5-phosphoribosyl)-5-[(5-phosphoribosylamino)methylideneamino]imidazole-4-carboxamide isomerase [Rhodospirillaceae bacterium]|jgi:phosphoribosylformimino-5-aminoimidazole carboxamide ribotide isomerase|nr:1-(5-phosphoribosyl)-5-[(5-phosphoribosylamino)methylideneamino]imidazole-4-carboxamide isomerase [Rhodospirillaceae bacterium]MBT5943920.1 1-(5-phosphoribosyl)-5-[(5-phosphoribosylamino)methylideneamino]imidazole-4-carboxamide isomerase [Rhodospirillaceae bacterium]MBT6402957.1 1-(5-phosphoribosyl)-5-[(5-phosphoribosylamino)methylideneamino]imidazole-4-carboxamide isomerase [Rhodospirillaceae bacterium]MBT6537034.1 1-(5-phosphoribosyl)-5-[(5-phosphoribosylamino)methylideneamino]imidazole-4-c